MGLEIEGTAYAPVSALLEELGVSRQTLWRWRREGKIPQGHRFRDGKVVFTEEEAEVVRRYANSIDERRSATAAELAVGIARSGTVHRFERAMQPERIEYADTSSEVVYLDNNATTRPLPEVVEAMVQILGPRFGNASSAHSGGDVARKFLSDARDSVADLIGATSENIFFTSSGTEANNMTLKSVTREKGLITDSIEHSSVIKTAKALNESGVPVTFLKPTRSGEITPESVAQAISKSNPDVVSVQWVNSETGTVNDIRSIGRICREAGVIFHTDAAQAVGKLKVNVERVPVDLLTFTAHKFNGPAGIGVVYATSRDVLQPLIHGGDQEGGLRAGTENLAGIVGAGVAAQLRKARRGDIEAQLTLVRDFFENSLIAKFPWIRVNGAGAFRVCNTSNLHFSGLDGQALVAQFDALGIHCSQSSACTNLRPEPSYVLREMGLSEKEAYASVRFSFGISNSLDEIEGALEQMIPVIQRLRDILI